MRSSARKLYDYRWELWLFVGSVCLLWIAETAIELVTDPSYGQMTTLRPVITLASLFIPYWWARRLNRPLLVALWQYLILVNVFTVFHVRLYTSVFDLDNPGSLDQPWSIPVLALSLASIYGYHTILLLAFGRRVSRVAMNRTVTLVLLVSLLYLDVELWRLYDLLGYSIQQGNLALELITPTLVGLALTYITRRADTARPLSTSLQLKLMSLAYAGYLLLLVWEGVTNLNTYGWTWDQLEHVLYPSALLALIPVVIWVGTLIAVYFWARRRPPPPINPFPPDEPDTLVTGPQHPVPVKQ